MMDIEGSATTFETEVSVGLVLSHNFYIEYNSGEKYWEIFWNSQRC